MAALLIAIFGIGGQLEDNLRTLREQINEQPASGDLVIVEIDAQSLQRLDNWPWPRSRYANAIERLNAAGVSQIAFDIDFSAHSVTEEDAALAEAIAQSEATVILPTFRQFSSAQSNEFIESLPIDALAEHAFLASINVHPDSNGQLNDYSYGTVTGGKPRPSLASMLSGSAGKVETSFAINQAIDPASIPRISFANLIEGKTAQVPLEGKKIIIGATAIELGDRYPIRSHLSLIHI